jgi:hypothetical protein
MSNKEKPLLEVFLEPLRQVVTGQELFSEPQRGLGRNGKSEDMQEMRETMDSTRESERFLSDVSSERVGLSAASGDAAELHEANESAAGWAASTPCWQITITEPSGETFTYRFTKSERFARGFAAGWLRCSPEDRVEVRFVCPRSCHRPDLCDEWVCRETPL